MNSLNLTNTRPDENAYKALTTLLQRLRVRVSALTVRETLPLHPDYPSLLSLSDALDQWQVDNTALQLNHVEQLRELPAPFIAHMTHQGGWFVVVEKVEPDLITWYDPASGTQTASPDTFRKSWNGVVLLAEPTPHAGERNFRQQRQREQLQLARTALLIAGAITLLAAGLYHAETALIAGLILVKAVGTIISVLLLIRQFDSQHPFINQLCTLGQKTDCQSVLDSPAANVTTWLSWSEIGFFYFAGGLLYTSIPEWLSGQKQILLGVFNLIALPYTLFSIYYQWRVARQWCTLCLIVQALLWIEFVIFQTGMEQHGLFRMNSLALATFAYGLPVLLYAFLKPFMINALQTRRYQVQLSRLKNDPAVFKTLLEKQPKAPDWLPETVITLGNPAAEHTLIMVTNLFCNPCKRIYQEAEQLLKKTNSINIKVVLYVTTNNQDIRNLTAAKILSLHTTDRSDALRNWFMQKKLTYSLDQEVHQKNLDFSLLKGHFIWCTQANIRITPTIFFSNYRLPNHYKITDIVQQIK